MSRFQDTNITDLIESRYSKSTKKMDKYCKDLLSNFLYSKNIENIPENPSEWDGVLAQFFAEVQLESGEPLSLSTFNAIKYGIARCLKIDKNIDILKDPSFKTMHSVCGAKSSHLKKMGKANIKHYDIISSDDLMQIGEYDATNDPIALQLKVWFIIAFHFLLRGREFIVNLIVKKISSLVKSNKEIIHYCKQLYYIF